MTASKRSIQPLLLGITGMMCAGKSTVSKILIEDGVPVYDADSRVKNLYDDPDVRNAIEKEFVPQKKYFYKGGLFDKEAAISYIFNEEKEFYGTAEYETKVRLELILSPFIFDDFEKFINANRGCNMVGFESATLLTMQNLCERMHYILWVDAKRETLLKRALERNGFSEKTYDSRMCPVVGDIQNTYYSKNKYSSSFKIKNEDGTTIDNLREQIYYWLADRLKA